MYRLDTGRYFTLKHIILGCSSSKKKKKGKRSDLKGVAVVGKKIQPLGSDGGGTTGTLVACYRAGLGGLGEVRENIFLR